MEGIMSFVDRVRGLDELVLEKERRRLWNALAGFKSLMGLNESGIVFDTTSTNNNTLTRQAQEAVDTICRNLCLEKPRLITTQNLILFIQSIEEKIELREQRLRVPFQDPAL